MLAYYLAILAGTLFDPVLFAPAILAGLISRNRWQALLGGLVSALIIVLVREHYSKDAIMIAMAIIAGCVWSILSRQLAAIFIYKRSQ